MADLKVTKMAMKVDLQCCKCYKKIKRVLCRYPREIRDQTYDEKNNRVFITVVCCNPECIMEKIICKAGDTVESIEIVPDKPAPAPTPKPTPAPAPTPKPTPAPTPVPMYPIWVCCCCCCEGGPCYHGRGPTCYDGCGRPAYMCQGSGNRGYYVSRCDEYFSEENALGCSVM